MYDMIKRACEQQLAVFQRRRDLTHLELSSSELRLLEDVVDSVGTKQRCHNLPQFRVLSYYTLPRATLQCRSRFYI